jgi:hypothetical protein
MYIKSMPKSIYGRTTQSAANGELTVAELVVPVKDIITRLSSIMSQILTMSTSPAGIDKNIVIQRINLLIEDLGLLTAPYDSDADD